MAPEPTNSQSGPTVIVADRSLIVQKEVQTALEQEHMHVLTTDNALSALTLAADEKPALIFLDTHLPHMNGFRVCSILRKNLRMRQIPVIMLAEKDGPFNKMQGHLAGVTDFLMKPLDSTELVETAKKYLENGPETLL